jgi:FkbM family methyltransferase
VGGDGVVHAFEPFPANIEQLRTNAAQTRHRNIRVWPIALSNHGKGVRFFVPSAHNSGNGYVVTRPDDAGPPFASEQVCELPCATLDSLLPQLGHARLLAIDAGGHEVAILQGASKYLFTHRPTIIIEVVERRLALSGATPEDVALNLRQFGYDLFEISRIGTRRIGTGREGIPRRGDWVASPSAERAEVERVNRVLRRCGLTPMMRGLNPLCTR